MACSPVSTTPFCWLGWLILDCWPSRVLGQSLQSINFIAAVDLWCGHWGLRSYNSVIEIITKCTCRPPKGPEISGCKSWVVMYNINNMYFFLFPWVYEAISQKRPPFNSHPLYKNQTMLCNKIFMAATCWQHIGLSISEVSGNSIDNTATYSFIIQVEFHQ